jgi:hypothetical protein
MLVWSWIFFGFYLNFYCLLFKFKFTYRWLKCFRKKGKSSNLVLFGPKTSSSAHRTLSAHARPYQPTVSRPVVSYLHLCHRPVGPTVSATSLPLSSCFTSFPHRCSHTSCCRRGKAWSCGHGRCPGCSPRVPMQHPPSTLPTALYKHCRGLQFQTLASWGFSSPNPPPVTSRRGGGGEGGRGVRPRVLTAVAAGAARGEEPEPRNLRTPTSFASSSSPASSTHHRAEFPFTDAFTAGSHRL